MPPSMSMMAPPMTTPNPMASMGPPGMPGPMGPPMTTPLVDPMASQMPPPMMHPMTTPLADPMASQMRPPGGYPGAMGPPPMMPPPPDPMESEAPRLWESQGPPRTTPLVDPAGPLPSDIFQSAAAVPTQLYSTGTFPTSENGFASAASVTMEPGPSKPSLWNSTTEGA